jgi:hypothetical protein
MILTNTTVNGVAYAHIISSARIGQKTGNALRAYAMSDPNPTTNIVLPSTKVDIQLFPIVVTFPLRGPTTMTPDILKPNIIAPGMNIFAAWSESVEPSTIPDDTRHVGFVLISELIAMLLPLNTWTELLHFLFSAVSDLEVANMPELALLDFIAGHIVTLYVIERLGVKTFHIVTDSFEVDIVTTGL